MEDLDAMIEEKQAAISKIQVQVDAILANEELARQRKALEEERAREDYNALARYEDTLVGRAAEDVNQAEKDVQSHAGSDEELKDALQAAAYAEADAKWNRENTMKDAERKVEAVTGFFPPATTIPSTSTICSTYFCSIPSTMTTGSFEA